MNRRITRQFSYKTPDAYRNRGFTLFEILVVVFIIGVILTFASLAVGTNADQRIEEEAKRLTALVRLASDEAIVGNRELGLMLGKTQYQFVTFAGNGQLAPIEDEGSPLRLRKLPDGIELAAEINGEVVTLVDSDFTAKKTDENAVSENNAEDDKKKESAPKEYEQPENPSVIFLLSSGEIVPFLVEVKREDGPSFVVKGDYNGVVEYLGRKKQEI